MHTSHPPQASQATGQSQIRADQVGHRRIPSRLKVSLAAHAEVRCPNLVNPQGSRPSGEKCIADARQRSGGPSPFPKPYRAIDGHYPRLLQGLDHCGEPPFGVDSIGIGRSDKHALSCLEPSVHGPRRPWSFLNQNLISPLPGDLQASVRAAVIDNKEIILLQGLGTKRTQGLGKGPLLIENGHH